MTAMIAEAFDKGNCVIMPDLDESSSQYDIDIWNTSNPKEYKIRPGTMKVHQMADR